MVPAASIAAQSPINARQAAWIRALDRARLVATRKPTYVVGKDLYRVHSDHSNNDYTVAPITTGTGHIDYTCTCEAGKHDRICWHKAYIAALPYEVSRRQHAREARA